jgi:electron transport complex protein RnfB
MMNDNQEKPDRRKFIVDALRVAGALGLAGGAAALAARKGESGQLVWQLDPSKCIACGNCATMCGYCDLCTGYFRPSPIALNSAAENQLCPTGAIKRTFVEDPYFEYTLDKQLCIGCGKCVKGCNAFGNGSLYLQVQHDRCRHCNECAIAIACPSQAYRRVPADEPYLLKVRGQQG